jgi:hypothetical protein
MIYGRDLRTHLDENHLKEARSRYKKQALAWANMLKTPLEKHTWNARICWHVLLEVKEAHGVELIRHKYNGTIVFYANMGDTYDQTVLAFLSSNGNVRFRLGDWGSLVETGRYE